MSVYAFDIKTSRKDYLADGTLRKPFPETAMQVCAYVNAEMAAVWRARQIKQFKRRYYLLSAAERALAEPVPAVDGALALLLTPTRYALHPLRCDDAVHESFLHLIDAARFPLEMAAHAVGTPLIPPHAFAPPPADAFKGLPTE
jgi:hypothetical protein